MRQFKKVIHLFREYEILLRKMICLDEENCSLVRTTKVYKSKKSSQVRQKVEPSQYGSKVEQSWAELKVESS